MLSICMEEDAANVESLTVKDRYFIVGGCGGDTQIRRLSSGTCRDCSDDYYCERTVNIGGSEDTETKPINMNVVFIMKIK